MGSCSTRRLCFFHWFNGCLLHIPIVKLHHHFNALFGNTNLISGRFCILDWLWPLEFYLFSLNPDCPFAITRVYVLLFTWMISWSFLNPSMLARKFILYCAIFLFVLVYILIFQVWPSSHAALFFFWPALEWKRHVCLSAFWQTSWDSAVHSCFVTEPTSYGLAGYVILGK